MTAISIHIAQKIARWEFVGVISGNIGFRQIIVTL